MGSDGKVRQGQGGGWTGENLAWLPKNPPGAVVLDMSIPHPCSFSILNTWLTWPLCFTETYFSIESKNLWLQGCRHGSLWQLFFKTSKLLLRFSDWKTFGIFFPCPASFRPCSPSVLLEGHRFPQRFAGICNEGMNCSEPALWEAIQAFWCGFLRASLASILPQASLHAEFPVAPPPQRLQGFSESLSRC